MLLSGNSLCRQVSNEESHATRQQGSLTNCDSVAWVASIPRQSHFRAGRTKRGFDNADLIVRRWSYALGNSCTAASRSSPSFWAASMVVTQVPLRPQPQVVHGRWQVAPVGHGRSYLLFQKDSQLCRSSFCFATAFSHSFHDCLGRGSGFWEEIGAFGCSEEAEDALSCTLSFRLTV